MFRALLGLFGFLMALLIFQYMRTGQRVYLAWSGRLIALALGSGVVFFAGLLVSRIL
jgi:hypothetical protein